VNSANVHRQICNTQDGYKKLHPGENMLRCEGGNRQLFVNAKRRVQQIYKENAGGDCPFPVLHTSSLMFDTPSQQQC
jgi:hypothetical protein